MHLADIMMLRIKRRVFSASISPASWYGHPPLSSQTPNNPLSPLTSQWWVVGLVRGLRGSAEIPLAFPRVEARGPTGNAIRPICLHDDVTAYCVFNPNVYAVSISPLLGGCHWRDWLAAAGFVMQLPHGSTANAVARLLGDTLRPGRCLGWWERRGPDRARAA